MLHEIHAGYGLFVGAVAIVHGLYSLEKSWKIYA